MWLADGWNDYTVLDASGGEKLERWGDYTLVRPDPQVIWHTGKKHPAWKEWDGYYHRSAKGGGSWETRTLPEGWSVSYPLADALKTGALSFHIRPFQFKHTGVFPEQAANWEWFVPILAGAGKRDPARSPRVLNLFAYTGGATIAAAAAGAEVTHVDAAKGMVLAAKENAVLSGLQDAPVRYLVDDCVKFVERELRRGNTYDAIIMDPPSYGRGPKGELWKMEDHIFQLLNRAASLLSDTPLFMLLSSYTTGLQPVTLSNLMKESLQSAGRNISPDAVHITADELCLPVKDSPLLLPCGASCRVTFG